MSGTQPTIAVTTRFESEKNFSTKGRPTGWKLTTVGEACKIINNLRKPYSEEERKGIKGHYPYYGPTKILDYINEYAYEGLHALIGEDGDHFLKYQEKSMTLLADGKFNVNNHAHVIKGKENCLTEWFHLFYRNRSLYSHLTRQGAKRYKLTKESLSQLPLLLPSIAEQRKIVEIIFNWDKAINLKEKLIEKKKEQKKGLMQKLLTGEVRLPDFKGEWTEVKLAELIDEVIDKSTINNQYELLSVTKNGIVSQSEHFNKQIASQDNIGYKIVRKNNLVFSTMNLWMGSLDVLTTKEIGIVSPAYKVFEFTKKLDPVYGKYFMMSDYMIWIYNINSEQGASIVRRNLDLAGLLITSLKVPSLEEQKAVANILFNLDH